jgi:hypothetical protein
MAPKERTEEAAEGVRWTEHLCRAADAFAREMRGVVPDDFSRHARGSFREALLAIRSIVDTGIQKLDEEDAAKKGPRKVKVE